MSDNEVISKCKENILDILSKNNGDIDKSVLYSEVEYGETVDIANAIAQLRNEGKIIILGTGKSARIMSSSSSNIPNLEPVSSRLVNPISRTTVFNSLYKTSETVRPDNTPKPPAVLKEEPVSELITKPLPKITGKSGILSIDGKAAKIAYTIFMCKDSSGYIGIDFDSIETRSKFKGTRSQLNALIQYLLTNEYIVRIENGRKRNPTVKWGTIYRSPFANVDDIPLGYGLTVPRVTEPSKEVGAVDNTNVEEPAQVSDGSQDDFNSSNNTEIAKKAIEISSQYKFTEPIVNLCSEIDTDVKSESHSLEEQIAYLDKIIYMQTESINKMSTVLLETLNNRKLLADKLNDVK